MKKILGIALIIILGFLTYSNSLSGKFIYDDRFLVKDNAYIKNHSNILKFFTENIGTGAGKRYYSYRPLQMITYMIDYSFWKLNVKFYHLTNILLHILVALCIYWLVNILYKDRLLSLTTGMLFVVHPLHTGAVSYISGRAEPLAGLFMLLCFILYVRYLRSKDIWIYISMLLSYICAVLSKESSLILPLLLLLYHYAFKVKFKTKNFFSILSVTLIYILLRFISLKALLPPLSSTTLFNRLPGFFAAITNYIKLLFLPIHLHMEYGYRQFNITNPQVIIGMVILFSILFYAFRKRKSNSLIFFSSFWFFIALLPQSNLYPINAYMAEHWLYIPSIGFFLMLAKGLSSLYRRREFRNVAFFSITGLLAIYSLLTIRQNEYWQEPITFYKRTLKYAPYNTKIYNNLGLTYGDLGKKEEAITLYKKAIEIDPYFTLAYINLGKEYSDLGKKEEAITLYKKAIEIDPDDPSSAGAYINLGKEYSDLGKKEEAITLYKKAIEINPNSPVAYNNLGKEYSDLGRKEEALILYKKAIRLDPDFAKAYNNLALSYSHLGKREKALTLYKKAIEIDPDFAGAYYNLGLLYNSIGKKEEAISSYKKAIELEPDLVEALQRYREKE